MLFYVGSNLVTTAYTVVLFVLMKRRRRAAIVNNLVFNAVSVVFVLAWLLLGEKSHVGTVVDVVPGIVGFGYVLFSQRVRNTFTVTRSPRTGAGHDNDPVRRSAHGHIG